MAKAKENIYIKNLKPSLKVFLGIIITFIIAIFLIIKTNNTSSSNTNNYYIGTDTRYASYRNSNLINYFLENYDLVTSSNYIESINAINNMPTTTNTFIDNIPVSPNTLLATKYACLGLISEKAGKYEEGLHYYTLLEQISPPTEFLLPDLESGQLSKREYGHIYYNSEAYSYIGKINIYRKVNDQKNRLKYSWKLLDNYSGQEAGYCFSDYMWPYDSYVINYLTENAPEVKNYKLTNINCQTVTDAANLLVNSLKEDDINTFISLMSTEIAFSHSAAVRGSYKLNNIIFSLLFERGEFYSAYKEIQNIAKNNTFIIDDQYKRIMFIDNKNKKKDLFRISFETVNNNYKVSGIALWSSGFLYRKN